MIWLLVGMMGTGKSTVAAMLAEEIGCDMVDIDAEVERASSRSITEIFATEGESGFRRLENVALARILRSAVEAAVGSRDLVVATGGGAVTAAESRALIRSLRESGRHVVVWLEASPETILARVGSSDRPLLGGLAPSAAVTRLQELTDARGPFYEECATVRIDTDGLAPAEVASCIRERVAAIASPTALDPSLPSLTEARDA